MPILILFSHSNIEIEDPIKIAIKFCEYFTNIGSSLAVNYLTIIYILETCN